MKTLTFTIDRSGQAKLTGSCGWGKDCMEATKDVEKRLGTVNSATQMPTEEFYKETREVHVGVEAGAH